MLLSTEEPETSRELDEVGWKRVTGVVENLFSVYMLLYMPRDEELGSLAPEWHRSRQVSMLAFLNYFNNGVMASPPQIVDRMKTYLQPFDGDIAHEVGISVSDALAIAEWISERLQASLDRCQEMAAEMQERRLSILNDAKSKRWSAKKREEATRELQRGVFAERLVAAINVVGTISFSEMLEAFPDTGKIFWPLFSVQRGAGPQIRYPTEQSIAETRPLISPWSRPRVVTNGEWDLCRAASHFRARRPEKCCKREVSSCKGQSTRSGSIGKN